jgi:hypothetical protein
MIEETITCNVRSTFTIFLTTSMAEVDIGKKKGEFLIHSSDLHHTKTTCSRHWKSSTMPLKYDAMDHYVVVVCQASKIMLCVLVCTSTNPTVFDFFLGSTRTKHEQNTHQTTNSCNSIPSLVLFHFISVILHPTNHYHELVVKNTLVDKKSGTIYDWLICFWSNKTTY